VRQHAKTTIEMTDVNADQIEYWSGKAGEKWVDGQQKLDEMLEPFGNAAMDAAQVGLGERVIDVGCGCGATSLELGRRVSLLGSVMGIDISGLMLNRAGERAAQESAANLTFAMADASTYRFERESADLVFSRFGVMFFRNPVEAFANLRAALKPTGRLAFVCWRSLDRNAWVKVPRDAALKHVPAPAPAAPDEPGPFAFADSDRVTGILRDAGFRGIVMEPHEIKVHNEGSLDEVVRHVTELGPTSRLLAEVEDDVRKTAIAEIREALRSHHDGEAIHMDAATWIVTAKP
jgi:SAM-dependent methyltransferase